MSNNKVVSRELIVMIGMSFSGKSYYVDLNYLPLYQLISAKHLKHAVETTKIKNPELVYASMDLIARAHMLKGLPIIVDESNLNIESIFIWKSITREFGYNIRGILIDTPLDVCIARLKYALNGESITEDMHENMTKEYEQVCELKKILQMKHQAIVDKVTIIGYDGGKI